MSLSLHRRLRNANQWISIANFLTPDRLKALGLAGGWATQSDLACDGRGALPAPAPELNTPPSNTGVNKVGDVALVDQRDCSRCLLIVSGVVVIDRCESCK